MFSSVKLIQNIDDENSNEYEHPPPHDLQECKEQEMPSLQKKA